MKAARLIFRLLILIFVLRGDSKPEAVVEADFKAWSVIYEALRFNASTLAAQLDGYDRKATTLIAAGGVFVALAASWLIQRGGAPLGLFLIATSAFLVLASIICGIRVLTPGLLEVPYMAAGQMAGEPGPRDRVAQNLAVTMSSAIEHSRATYSTKRFRYQLQQWVFLSAVAFLTVLMAFGAVRPEWIFVGAGAAIGSSAKPQSSPSVASSPASSPTPTPRNSPQLPSSPTP